MKKSVLLICITLFIPVILSAGNDEFIHKQKIFIDQLYKEHRYFDAIAETEKLKVYSNRTDNSEADYFICMIYYLAELYRSARALCINKNSSTVNLPDFIRAASYL